MLRFEPKLPNLRAWLEKRRRAWAERLLPKTHKDAWRGTSKLQRGLRCFTYGAIPGFSYFVLRRSSNCSYLAIPTYTLVVSWRYRWYVTIPLSSGATNFSYDPLKGPLGGSVNPTISAIEAAVLTTKLFSVDTLVLAYWRTLLRGLGGLSRLKLRYKGKSFKWHRRGGALLLRFGHSHLVALSPLPGLRWRRFGRMKIILYGSNWWDLVDFARTICWWRPVNVYHGRGIRLRRQAVLRKSGKVSAYR